MSTRGVMFGAQCELAWHLDTLRDWKACSQERSFVLGDQVPWPLPSYPRSLCTLDMLPEVDAGRSGA